VKLSSLSVDEASSLSVQILGLDSTSISLTSAESLAASLRRAASFMCPTSPSRLVDAVMETIAPVSANSVAREHLVHLLDLLVAGGDLLELRDNVGRATRLLFLGPPSYIERAPGTYLLVGIRPFGTPLVTAELGEQIEWEGHTRTIHLGPETAAEQLAAADLQPIERERWVAGPRSESAQSLVLRLVARLDAAGPSGDIQDLVVLDPTTPVRYYRGRWRSPKQTDSGNFIARRPQAYGADLWCFVRLKDGQPKRLIDFPIDDPVAPGRDDAWRVQMAIDALRGAPQQYCIVHCDNDAAKIEFFSPIPGFAERYLQLVGLALDDTKGALFSFRVPNAALTALERLLGEMLWLIAMTNGGSQ
jgi:hypothetical protein